MSNACRNRKFGSFCHLAWFHNIPISQHWDKGKSFVKVKDKDKVLFSFLIFIKISLVSLAYGGNFPFILVELVSLYYDKDSKMFFHGFIFFV